MTIGNRALILCLTFLSASVYSLYSGWWNAAGWFGVLTFSAMWSALNGN